MFKRYVILQFEEKLSNKAGSYSYNDIVGLYNILSSSSKISICEMKKFITKFNLSDNVYSFGTVETYFMPVVARL